MKKILLALGIVCLIVIGFPTAIAIMVARPIVVEDDPGVNMRLYDYKTGKIISMTIEEYLVGVVAAEMPITFELEALKAQAVAARTYALKRINEGKNKKWAEHNGADLCSNPSHCQAWDSRDTLMSKWKIMGYTANLNKITDAVSQTKSLVITYEGNLIDAVYHASCGGHTENSEAVWQSAVPYLVGRPCDYEQENNWQQETKTVTINNLKKALNTAARPVMASTSSIANTVKVLSLTNSQRVNEVSVFGSVYNSKEVRQALGLKSTRFTVEVAGNDVKFTTYGYGHGVGMCQYGANGMAKASLTFEDIIKHYYSEVQISKVVTW